MSVSIGDVIGSIRLEDTFSPKLEIAARNVEQFAGKLDRIGSRFEDVGKKLSVSVTLPIAAITGMAVKSSVALNETLANVSALLTDVAGPELDRVVGSMKGQVQELARDMGKSTKDISEGLYEVISSLGNTEDTLGQLEISAKAAAAGLATTQEAFGLLSAVTKTYGDTSETAFKKVADLAFQAVNIGQTTFPQLSASIGSVASIAQYAGVPLEELFAIIATATGVTGNTSEVTTQMASAISALIDPSKELNKLFKEQGLASAQAAIAEKGLAGTLQMIVDHANATGKPLADLLGRKEAILLAASLAGSQEEQFAKNLTKMGEAAAASGGIVEGAFNKQTQGVNKAGFAWKQFLADVEIAQQKLGDQLVPILLDVGESLRPMFDVLLKLIELFGKLPDPVKASVVVLAGLAALSGPVLFTLGGILQGATYLIPVIKTLTAVQASLNGAILATQAGYGKLVLLNIASTFREWAVAAQVFATSIAGIGLAIVGVLLLLNQLITKWKETMQAAIEYDVAQARVEGRALKFVRDVQTTGGKATQSALAQAKEDLNQLTAEIIKQKQILEQYKPRFSKETGAEVAIPENVIRARESLKTLEAAYSRLQKGIEAVKEVVADAPAVMGGNQPPVPPPPVLSEEQEKALNSINSRVAAMAREMAARTALLAALKQSPEAYLAEQRAQEINNAVFEARQELLQSELALSPELQARIEQITGSIFDSTIATEKYNEALAAVATSVSSLSSINIPKLTTGGDTNALKQWAGSLSDLGFELNNLRLNLRRLPQDSAEYKTALAVLTETEKRYQAEISRLPQIMEDRKSAWDSEMRSALAVAESTSRQINKEIEVLGKGAGAWSRYQREQEARAKAIQTLGVFNLPKPDSSDRKALAEWRSLFDQYNKQLASLTRDIQVRLDFEIAADLKLDLQTPLQELRAYKASIDVLTQSFDQSGRAALSAAEAARLKARADEQFATDQINNWAGFLSQLGDQLGGFFAQVASLASSIQGVNSTAQSLGGWSSMAGAWGGTIAAFVAAYQYADAIITKHKGEKYGTRTELNIGDGIRSTSYFSQAGMELSRAIQDVLKSLEDQLRISVDDLAEIEIRVRNNGEAVQAWVKGEWVGTFSDVNTAIREALLVAMSDPESSLRGMSALMTQGLAEWTSPDMEGLLSFLEQLRAISDLDLSPAVIGLQQSFLEINRLREALDSLDQSSQDVIDAYKSLADAQKRLYDQTVNSLLGIDTSAADAVRSLAAFQKGIGDVQNTYQAGIQATINAIKSQIKVLDEAAKRSGKLGDPEGGGGARPNEGGGSGGADLIARMFSDTTADVLTERQKLEQELEEWTKKLGEIPQALSESQIDLGIFTAIEGLLRKSGKHAELVAKFERMRVEAQFQALKLQLIAIGAWERWASIWSELYAQAIADAGKMPNRPAGGGVDRKEIRKDLLEQIADIEAELKGPLHTAFLQFSRTLDEFEEQAKKGKLSAEDLARGIAAITAKFQENIRAQANAFAGIGTDFTKRLDGVMDFFKELRELGRKKTGMPNWLVDVLEGKALEGLGKELNGAIAAFGGLVDPMLAVNAQADTLRQNVLAYAEAAGWSADQVAAAMAAIDRGVEYQRQQGINGLLDRLFSWAKQAGILTKESLEHERSKALLDLSIIEAQFRFYGALTAEVEGWIGDIRDWINSAAFGLNNNSGGVQDVRIVGDPADWDSLIDEIKTLVEAWRAAVDQFADATNNLMTDESLTNLTQEEQLAYAKAQAEDLAAKARAGDADALAKLDAARAEYLRELRESEGTGFGFTEGFNWIMGLSADILENAQSAEDNMIADALADNVSAWAYVMQQLADQLEAAFYENNQDLIDAIYRAIGGVPGFAKGGIVMRGPRLVRVAEQVAEAIVPLDKLATAIPYNRLGMAGQTVDHTAGAQRSGSASGADSGISVYDQSARFRSFQRQDDSTMRLAKIESSNQATAQAMVRMQQDMNALRRRLSP
jgi:TP901 family phage tail tape measure protein